ncbi:hypothetical protein ykris0001_40340 [Yersinia kristensenii ATCC 33638]|nr:hypothetical protein ykris0001_40340 [Yersinia kristensenii ATCC 33638]
MLEQADRDKARVSASAAVANRLLIIIIIILQTVAKCGLSRLLTFNLQIFNLYALNYPYQNELA